VSIWVLKAHRVVDAAGDVEAILVGYVLARGQFSHPNESLRLYATLYNANNALPKNLSDQDTSPRYEAPHRR
jgi:hypothetical protein